MQRLQHQPVAAQRHNNVGLVYRHSVIFRFQLRASGFGILAPIGDKGQLFYLFRRAHVKIAPAFIGLLACNKSKKHPTRIGPVKII